MLVGRRRRFLHRSLPGGVVLEVLAGGGRLLFSGWLHFCACLHLVFSTSSRSRWSLVGGCFAAVLLWRLLYRRRLVESLWVDALPPLYWLVGWMLCHLVCVADLRTFGDVVSYGRFSCWLALVWPRLGLLGLRGSPPSCFCCWVSVWSLGVLFVFLQFFLYFYSFVILCWSSSVWPHQELSVNCFLLNEIRAQARSRKKNWSTSCFELQKHGLHSDCSFLNNQTALRLIMHKIPLY